MSDSQRSGFSALLWAKKSVQEGTVDTKRLIGTIVAAFVILFVAGFWFVACGWGNNTKAIGN